MGYRITYQMKKYAIVAKRNEADRWSMWAETDDYEKATQHLNRCKELGYIAKIVEIDEHIKELAQELCDKSGCHHKCKEIDECVVMEEAEELLINQDKSNNFDVKSNNLPSVLTNEEKVSVKGK